MFYSWRRSNGVEDLSNNGNCRKCAIINKVYNKKKRVGGDKKGWCVDIDVVIIAIRFRKNRTCFLLFSIAIFNCGHEKEDGYDFNSKIKTDFKMGHIFFTINARQSHNETVPLLTINPRRNLVTSWFNVFVLMKCYLTLSLSLSPIYPPAQVYATVFSSPSY